MHEREWADYERDLDKEMRREWQDSDPVLKRCRFVSFVSHSSGRGRRRKPREVNLLVIDKKYAYQVIRGEVRPRRNNSLEPDAIALEILSDLPYEERSAETLLQRAMRGT